MIAQRLPDHVLDADVLTNDAGAWFTHDHPHTHPDQLVHGTRGPASHTHRHDHRRRSHRDDYDHHPIDDGGG